MKLQQKADGGSSDYGKILSTKILYFPRVIMDHSNHLENLELDLEHDSGRSLKAMDDLDQEIMAEIAAERIILCGDQDNGDRAYESTSYIWVDPDYSDQLSPGQWQMYELLRSLQLSSDYTATSIGKLAEAQQLKNPLSCSTRLENLQSLGAIHGLKI
ncbi:MAG: hypothetical protein AAGD25_24655 [Cyanobacteria bacterium P01_F01_bin.150]